MGYMKRNVSLMRGVLAFRCDYPSGADNGGLVGELPSSKPGFHSERGETMLSVIFGILLLSIGWFIFFTVKDWIKDYKDRRDGVGQYKIIERELDGPFEPAGYSITFYP